jgi:regulator of sigma E protease
LEMLINILKVAFGLGFVIFLHELGHFLLAKWNGVKVEKFSIGFGPTILGFKKGETEYVLAVIPLGGFVKMLGEGPEEEAAKSSDPRAYPNKTVGARMAIISAGVIMNLILGLGCFVYAYQRGMDEVPTKIGAVVPGSPAFEAGIRAGDEIVAMDGRRDLNFSNLQLKVRLSGQGQVVHFELKRPGQDSTIPLDIEPRRAATADVPGIGIQPGSSITLALPPYRAPAGLTEPVKTPTAGLEVGDRVVAAGEAGKEPTPVSDVLQLHRLLARDQDKKMDLVVERDVKDKEGRKSSVERVEFALPPNRFVDFGFRLKIEPIVALRNDSPAARAEFRKGDTIVKVDGEDFDPMRLPSICYDKAGQPMTFEVERPEVGGPPRTLTLKATPDDSLPWPERAVSEDLLEVPGLGLAYRVRTKIEAVTPDSPAAKAGLKVGDVINAVSFPSIKVKPWVWPLSLIFSTEAKEILFDDKSPAWPSFFQELQIRPTEPIALRVNNSDAKVIVTPTPELTWFRPHRGEQFQIEIRRTSPMTIAMSLQRGFDDTVENILSIYAMFRSLAQRRVSPKGLGGPILIANVAYEAAGLGMTELVHFLGILSINLAVLNFLPVPPLDGGQMVFLAAEKVRGRPLPDSALIAGTYLGLLLVLMLMAFVIFQDVSRLVTG